MKLGFKRIKDNLLLKRAYTLNSKNSHRSGFTLMEIMVVVVIIAVLASVAGPMIGDIVDQGRASATKSKLSSIKSALVTYKNDVGRYPFYGDRSAIASASAYCAEQVLSTNSANNVLVNIQTDIDYKCDGACADVDGTVVGVSGLYGKGGRKWKGPYMDADPSDFMIDSWGNTIRYVAYKNNLYLWSAGSDGEFEEDTNGNPTDDCLNTSKYEEGDINDIILSVARFKRKFN